MATGPVQPAALLVTGTVGSGKTAVGEAIADVLVGRGVPHALVDLDQLRLSWPPPDGDRFNHAMELRNLRSVAENYRAAGALRLVLAGVIEHRSAVKRYQRTVDCAVQVVRLRAHPDALVDRLRDRHRHDQNRLSWHLVRAPELDAILDQAGVADIEIETTGRPIADVAVDVLSAVGW